MTMQTPQAARLPEQRVRQKSVLRRSEQIQNSLQQSICGIPRNRQVTSGLSVDRFRLWITFLGQSKKNSYKVIDFQTLQCHRSKCNDYNSHISLVMLVSWPKMAANIFKVLRKHSSLLVMVIQKQMLPYPDCNCSRRY